MRQLYQMETIEDLKRLVDSQAEDEGLWFVAKTLPEEYLMRELRRLHSAVEWVYRHSVDDQ